MSWFAKNNTHSSPSYLQRRQHIRETAIFAVLGALMFVSKLLMEILPNVHLLGMFIVAFTVVFRAKALYPIYIYVFLDGIFHGFDIWWLPYLYIWTVLWGMVMLLPRNMPKGVCAVVYPIVCALHGFLFGILYAPAQILMFSLTPKEAVAWVAAGLAFDITHGVSNLFMGLLVLPLVALMRRLLKRQI